MTVKNYIKYKRGQYDINNYSDKNPNKFFQQSEIYYKLTHSKNELINLKIYID